MGKFFKTLATAVMAAVLSVTCLGATSAQAADSYSKTVTFSNVKDGDTINVYKLGGYEDSSYNSFKFDDSFADFLRERQGAGHDSDDQKALMTYLQGFSNNQAGLSSLMSAYANSWNSSLSGAPTSYKSFTRNTASDPQCELEPGYYLVLPQTTGSNSSLYNPVVVSVRVSGNQSLIYVNGALEGNDASVATVSMKVVDGPQIDKYVLRADTKTLRRTKTVGIGDLVTYVVELTVPSYSDAFDPELSLKDTLSNLEYVKDSVKVYSDFTEGHDFSDDNLIQDAVSGIDDPTYSNGSQSITFNLEYDKINGEGAASKTVYIAYQAKVMSDIVSSSNENGQFVGSNVAYLQYRTSANADTNSQTASYTTNVYTYEFKLVKLDGSRNPLSGAKFQLFSKKGDGNEQQLAFKEIDGYYVIASANDSGAITEIPADSTFDIRGLDPFNTYYVKESTTPNGYYAPAGRYVVSMKSAMDSGNSNEHSGNLANDSKVTPEFAENNNTDGALVDPASVSGATFTMTLRNSNMPVLPSTGGMGTALFTIGGVALMVVAAVAFVVIRRRNEQR